ncbi:MAG TPA: phage holin family protein [Gaiellaceae bacterium]|jgi:uncharacterized membrane protein YvlD (DUF360 family)|nr:phage holin family protein [Gaiellaceae bacterium]
MTSTEQHTPESPGWSPRRPKIRPFALAVAWLVSASALLVAAEIVPGATVNDFGGALAAAAAIAVLNAIVPPLLAALRLPLMLLTGLVLILVADALMLLAADSITDGDLQIDSFWSALGVAFVASAVGVVIEVVLGTNDDDTYTLKVIQRIARRSGGRTVTDSPGIVFLEIDGLALPVLQRAMRDGSAPTMARWVADGTHRFTEWETDLSSQTGASQAGILLGSNDDIPAFRWVEKETAKLVACSGPPDCAEIERRHASGRGLLVDGGASRGNLLSGEADEVILTVSRMDAEKGANPGYRAFFANGFNVVRVLVLFFWEVVLEWSAAGRAKRRDVRPRGHRGGLYPFMRAALCVVVRDLIVYGVLTDMMKGRPAIYATFSSYDEVAHHSGLERADTLEALRKLDEHFRRIERARPYAARPYEIVVLSDHGQTQGATFKQRNGYGLDELVERSLERGAVATVGGGDENHSNLGNAVGEATVGTAKKKRPKNDVSDKEVVVLGSGNLGLVYLMSERRRLTREEIDEQHPRLLPALRSHPHVGWLLVRSERDGAVALGANGAHHLADGTVDGEDPLAHFSPNAPRHLLRTDGFEHVADIMVGSFYDPALDEGCAFEELISFHGGIGGAQTRPFLLAPVSLPLPDEPIVGASAVHAILSGWRRTLNGSAGPVEPRPLATTTG